MYNRQYLLDPNHLYLYEKITFFDNKIQSRKNKSEINDILWMIYKAAYSLTFNTFNFSVWLLCSERQPFKLAFSSIRLEVFKGLHNSIHFHVEKSGPRTKVSKSSPLYIIKKHWFQPCIFDPEYHNQKRDFFHEHKKWKVLNIISNIQLKRKNFVFINL